MSMHDLKQELKGVAGIENLTMDYEDGGKVQAFKFADKVVRVGPTASTAEVKAAILKEVGG